MKKKRIAAAGLAVIMALTAAGCHQTSKEDTAQTTVKENIQNLAYLSSVIRPYS